MLRSKLVLDRTTTGITHDKSIGKRYVVTDSGLGGLSVAAGIHEGLKSRKRSGEVIFVNAWPDWQHSYNAITTANGGDRSKATRVFDSALRSMRDRFEPDRLLVACNTLSAMYPDTDFSRETDIPVDGIVDLSTRLMLEALREDLSAKLIVLGTTSLIRSRVYPNALVAAGIPKERVISKRCPKIVRDIDERGGPESEETRADILHYMEKAAEYLGPSLGSVPVVLSLQCTHYGYCEQTFAEMALRAGLGHVIIINPNTQMVTSILDQLVPLSDSKVEGDQLSIRVYSQIEYAPLALETNAQFMEQYLSEDTAQALRNINYDAELFPWRHLI